MLLQKQIASTIQNYLKTSYKELNSKLLKDKVQIDPAKNQNYGDFSTTCPLALSKQLKKAPIAIANEIKEHLEQEKSDFYTVEVAPPGFVNFRLTPEGFHKLAEHLNNNELIEKVKKENSVLLEYVSANPTGALHMGHGRGAVVGSSLASVLKATGRNVGTEFYVNDAGEQMQKLGRTAWSIYKNEQLTSDEYPPELVKPYLDGIEKDKDFDELTEIVKTKILNKQKEVLANLNVEFDKWVSEKEELHKTGKLENALTKLKEAKLTYEKDDALWFNSSSLGDERDRVLVKSDKRATYLAADIAYHLDKFDRYDELINIWGADHQGQEVSMQVALKALGTNPKDFEILFIQFVSLVEGDKEVKMSKRQGTVITIEEVVEKVGVDAFRFFLLLSHVNNRLAFDLDLALKTDDQNPVFYVQYAHARACSILRNATEKQANGDDALCSLEDLRQATASSNIFSLALSNELSEEQIASTKNLILKLSFFNDEIHRSAVNMNPSSIAHYLIDLANHFHSFYSHCRAIDFENKELSLARLVLIKAFARVLKTGLNVLLVSAPEKM